MCWLAARSACCWASSPTPFCRFRCELPARKSVSYIEMLAFLLWVILLIVCWPVALVLLILSPLIWLILLPFRIVGIAVEGVFDLIRAIFLLPARVLGGRRHGYRY